MTILKKEPTRSAFLRLHQPAALVSSLRCDICQVDVEIDAEGWHCPSCGTQWNASQDEGSIGILVQDYWPDKDIEEHYTDVETARVRGAEAVTQWVWAPRSCAQ